MILHQINSIKDHNAFVPVKLPIHTSFEKVINVYIKIIILLNL